MRLPAYPGYKRSGVEWLGEVPVHWDAQGVKFCYSIQLGKMLQPEPSSPSDEVAPYLKSQHVQWEHVRVTDLPTMWTTKTERKKYAVTDGDLLVCEGGDVGRAAVVHGAPDGTIIQNALHRVRPKSKNEVAFLLYVLAHAASQDWFEIVCNRSTIAHFTVDKFGALGVALPTPTEQQAIVEFLDRETGRIDRILNKKWKLIERLKEKRTALISRTITRGLPPIAARAAGLPENAPLKPSGVPWFDKYPRHWLTKRLRHISDFVVVGVVVNPSSYVTDEGVVFLLGGNVREMRINTTDCKRCSVESSNGPLVKSRLDAGDIVVVRVGYPGVASVVPPELAGGNVASMMLVRKHARFSSQWLAYAFNSQVGRDQVEIVQYGAAQKQFNISHAVDFAFPFPPLPEQVAIAAYLDTETAKLDALVRKVEEAIERLQEYRTALITAAVTGKIDVRKTSSG